MLPHCPAGESHRYVSFDQKGLRLEVAHSSGSGAVHSQQDAHQLLVKTEERTRVFTDAWKANLLMQKKPNDDGIQCHDPRLNKYVVVHKAGDYNKHIKISGNPKPALPCSEHPKFRKTKQSSASLPALGLGGGLDQEVAPSEESKWGGGPHVAANDHQVSTPPPATVPPRNLGVSSMIGENNQNVLANTYVQMYSTGDESGSYNNDPSEALMGMTGMEFMMDNHKPRPLSPATLAQKLRRYKIGSSPKQKVRHMLDDMVRSSGSERAKRASKKDVGRGHSLVRMGDMTPLAAGETKDGVAVLPGLAMQPQSTFDDCSLWDETGSEQLNQEQLQQQQRGGNFTFHLPAGKGDDGAGGNGTAQIDINELSNTDYLYLQREGLMPMQQQGTTTIKNQAILSDNMTTDGFSGTSRTGSEVSNRSSHFEGMVITGKGSSKPRSQTHSQVSVGTLSAVDVASMLDHSRISGPEPQLRGRGKRMNTEGDERDESTENSSIPSLQTFTSNVHAQYMVDFDIAKKKGWRTQKSGKKFDLAAATTGAVDMHRLAQPWKVYRQPCKYDYESGEEVSRDAFSEEPTPMIVHAQHPICHNCVRPGRLWCDSCRKVYCYNCWGLVEHHEARHATVELDKDVSNLKPDPVVSQSKSMPELLAPFHGAVSASSLPTHAVLGTEMELSLEASQEQGNDHLMSKDQQSNIQISLPFPSGNLNELNSNSVIIDAQTDNNTSLDQAQSMTSLAGLDDSDILINNGNDNGNDARSVPRPMTDRIGSECGSEPDEELSKAFGSAFIRGDNGTAPAVGATENSKIAQFSSTNSAQHYFNQVTTPFVPPGSQKQQKLIDTYVEYDEINVIHFSPAKKDPEKVRTLREHYDGIMAVTSERNRGYAEEVAAKEMRQKLVATKIKETVHLKVNKHYPTRQREQGKRQVMRMEAARVDGRAEPKMTQGVGKLVSENLKNAGKNILSIQGSNMNMAAGNNPSADTLGSGSGHLLQKLSLTEVKEAEPVLLFENSPLNRNLEIPKYNADGSPHRIPPNAQEKFMLEKGRKEKKLQKARLRAQAKAEKLEVSQLDDVSKRNYNSVAVAQGDGAFVTPSAGDHAQTVQQQVQVQPQPESGNEQQAAAEEVSVPLFKVIDSAATNNKNGNRFGDSEAYSSDLKHSSNSSSNSSEKEKEILEKMREDWGFNPKRAKSSHSGNFPSLPFLGPPYTVDLETEEHFNTAIRPFSPAKDATTINKKSKKQASSVSRTPGRHAITPYSKGQTPMKEKNTLWGSFKKTTDSVFDPDGLV